MHHKELCKTNCYKTAKSKLTWADKSYGNAKTKYDLAKKEFHKKEKLLNNSKRKIKRYYSKDSLFG